MKPMKTKWTLLLACGLGTLLPGRLLAQTVDLRPMLVHDVTGTMDIHQATPWPCPDLDGTVKVTGGRFEIAPSDGIDLPGGGKRFVLTGGNTSIHPFTINYSCAGNDTNKSYEALSVQLSTAAPFVATPVSSLPPGNFTYAIPAKDVLLYEAATVNGAPEVGYSHPSDPVTGLIDLPNGTVTMKVVVPTKISVDILGDFDGALTAHLSGALEFRDVDADGVPDRTDNCRLVANVGQKPVTCPLVRGPVPVTRGTCLATEFGQPIAVDVCEGGPVTVTHNAPYPFPLGTTVVTWTGVDGLGHARSANQSVKIVDQTPPEFTLVQSDITLANCGPVALGSPLAIDDCGGTVTFSNNAPATYHEGTTVVTWTATDASGNHATETQSVTVQDKMPPTITCSHVDNMDSYFQTFGKDDCSGGSLVMKLRDFILVNHEILHLTWSDKPGVRFLGLEGREQIKHFQVGPDDAVITGTVRSCNESTAKCVVTRRAVAPPRS
jgi:hypothetical protein